VLVTFRTHFSEWTGHLTLQVVTFFADGIQRVATESLELSECNETKLTHLFQGCHDGLARSKTLAIPVNLTSAYTHSYDLLIELLSHLCIHSVLWLSSSCSVSNAVEMLPGPSGDFSCGPEALSGDNQSSSSRSQVDGASTIDRQVRSGLARGMGFFFPVARSHAEEHPTELHRSSPVVR